MDVEIIKPGLTMGMMIVIALLVLIMTLLVVICLMLHRYNSQIVESGARVIDNTDLAAVLAEATRCGWEFRQCVNGININGKKSCIIFFTRKINKIHYAEKKDKRSSNVL